MNRRTVEKPSTQQTFNKIMPPPPPKNRRSSITAMITEEIPSFNPIGRKSDILASAKKLRKDTICEETTTIMQTPAAGCSSMFNTMSTIRANVEPTSNLKGKPIKSLIPTPICRPPVMRSGVARQLSLPADQASVGKPPKAGPSQRGRTLQTATSASTKITSMKRSTSNLSAGPRTTISKNKGKTLTRANSMESFGWFNSTCGTPGTTRRIKTLNLSTAKKPAFSAISDNTLPTGDAIQKVLKVPASSDKHLLNQIVLVILDLLGDFEYPKRMTIFEFNAMPVQEYFNICQFFLNPIKYGRLTGTKPEEISPQLFEVANLLKYPGILNKGAFKSVNVPHGRPAAITFLLWLGCRIAAICTPRQFGCKTNTVVTLRADKELDFTGLMMESYRRLFLISENQLAAGFGEELEAYESRIREIYTFGDDETVESLEMTLEKKKDELAAVESIPDPDLEVQEEMQKSLARKEAVIAKQAEIRALISKYKNVEHFAPQKEMLAKKIAHEEECASELAARVAQQPVSVQGLETMVREIDTIKKQEISLEQVIDGMRNKLAIRNQTSKNSGSVFYKLCEKFRVIDDFNDHLSTFENLGVVNNMEKAKRNPFSHHEFEAWLKDVKRVVRHTDRIMSELKLNIQHNWKYDANKKKVGYEEDIERYSKEISIAEMEIEKLKETGLKERSQLKLLIGARGQEKKEAIKLMEKIQGQLDIQQSDLAKLQEALQAAMQRDAELTEEVKQSHTNVEDAYLEAREKKILMISEHVDTIKRILKEHTEARAAERDKIMYGPISTEPKPDSDNPGIA